MFKTNQYFDGNVVSIAFEGEALPSTVGVIAPGEYTFDTNKHEVMTVISGQLDVQLPNTEDWASFVSGQQFKVAANSTFNVKSTIDTAYLCTYE